MTDSFLARRRVAAFALLLCTCSSAPASPVATPPVAPDPDDVSGPVSLPEPTPSEAPQATSSAAQDESVEPAGSETGETGELAGEPEPTPESEVEIPELSDKLRKRILAVQSLVDEKSLKHGVDPSLLNAMIWVESKFDPKARGPAGAQGLMQIMPKTGRSLAKRLDRKARPYDPDFSIDAGALYLARLLKRFDADPVLALAAYNRGVGRVAGWIEAGETIPERTQAYVDRVLAAQRWLAVFVAKERARAAQAPLASRTAAQTL